MYWKRMSITGPGGLLDRVEQEVKSRDSRVVGIKCSYPQQGPRYHLEVLLRPDEGREMHLPVSLPAKQFDEEDVKSAASKILWAVEHGLRVFCPGENTFKVTA